MCVRECESNPFRCQFFFTHLFSGTSLLLLSFFSGIPVFFAPIPSLSTFVLCFLIPIGTFLVDTRPKSTPHQRMDPNGIDQDGFFPPVDGSGDFMFTGGHDGELRLSTSLMSSQAFPTLVASDYGVLRPLDAPLSRVEDETRHQFAGGIQVAEPVDVAQVPDMFPLEEADNESLGVIEQDDSASHFSADMDAHFQQEDNDHISLVPVATEILPPFGTGTLAKQRDNVVEVFRARLEVVLEALANATTAKQKSDLYEPFRALWDEWQYLWANHIITAAPSLDYFVHKARLEIPPALAQAGYAYNAQASTKPKVKAYDKVATAFITREPAPCAPDKAVKIGPFRFDIILRPGLAVKSVGLRATTVACQYADWSSSDDADAAPSKGGKDSSPGLEHAPLVSLGGNSYSVQHVSFLSTSAGRVFEVDFCFTLYLEDKTNHDIHVRSLPMACVSNVGSQWVAGEGRYVASLAFGMCGTKGAPFPEVRYPALVNALQFAYLTCTRQIASAFYVDELREKSDKAKKHFERKKTKSDSGRSQSQQNVLKAYNSFHTHSRVHRMLTEEEIRSVFPPTPSSAVVSTSVTRPSSKAKGGAFNADSLPPLDATTNDGAIAELITYDYFCKHWLWYGSLMYRIYTGQIEGFEVRSLWLFGLIHLVSPTSTNPLAILSNQFGIGSALIRTSRTAGQFTYNFVQARTGDNALDFSFKPIVVSGTDYATALHNEGAIVRLVNICGLPIDKAVVVRAYKEVQILPEDRNGIEYRRNLEARAASRLVDNLNSMQM